MGGNNEAAKHEVSFLVYTGRPICLVVSLFFACFCNGHTAIAAAVI